MYLNYNVNYNVNDSLNDSFIAFLNISIVVQSFYAIKI